MVFGIALEELEGSEAQGVAPNSMMGSQNLPSLCGTVHVYPCLMVICKKRRVDALEAKDLCCHE